MAIRATAFTGFQGGEATSVEEIESEIDKKLEAAIGEAVAKGDSEFRRRYEFQSSTSVRVREEIRRRYEAAGWHVGWTNTETREGIYLSAVVRDRRKS